MRCSYYKTSSKSNSSNNAVNIINYRILQDLNKHNWLLKKLKWGMKTNDTNHKHAMDIRRRELADYLRFNNVEVKIATKGSSGGDARVEPSVSVSLPLKIYNNLNVRGSGDNNSTTNHSVPDNKTLEPKGEETCKEIKKEFDKSLQVSEASARSGIRGSNCERNKEGIKKNNQYVAKNMHEPESKDNLNNVSTMPSVIIERKKYIKHNLPISAPPERTKYVYKNSASGTSCVKPVLNSKPALGNKESQTHDVIIIDQSTKEIIDFITLNNITMDHLQKIVANVEKKNDDTDMVTDDNNNNTNEIKLNNNMQVLEACSIFNKEIIAYNSKVSRNVSESERLIEHIKIKYLGQILSKMFGSVFEKLAASLNLDVTNLDPKIPDVVPNIITLPIKRPPMAIDSPQDLPNNEDLANDSIPQQVQVPKKPLLRAQRKSTKASASPVVSHPPVPQCGQIQQTTKMVHVETNYCNTHAPRGDYMDQQYPSPQPHRVQNDNSTFYNQGPRMMQPHALQLAREQHAPHHYPGNSWNYHFNHHNIMHSMYNTTYMSGVQMPPHVMPTPEQENYLRMHLQRNTVHTHPCTTWHNNMAPNGSM